ncbi:MAG: pyridoxine 5'-phosphate synthase, partial [Leptospiraceae bacterium]|nr:pyridoxine 5'-phosphate synthase [Leptospiraceae bacterium]
SGAYGITVHPREDERHIKKTDVSELKNFLNTYNQKISQKKEFNIEGEPSKRFLDIIFENLPDQATLVPVHPGEITSDHGFDLQKDSKFLSPIIQKIKEKNIRVSLFVEAGAENLNIAKDIGADRIELYTGPFAFQFEKSVEKGKEAFILFEKTAMEAMKLGLGINAGHDLDHKNLMVFRNLSGLEEVSIGHRLISYALHVGIENSVKAYLKALSLSS